MHDKSKKLFTWSSGLESKLKADGRPSRVEKATLPPLRGDISEYSEVQRARVSSPLLAYTLSGRWYVSRHVALENKNILCDIVGYKYLSY